MVSDMSGVKYQLTEMYRVLRRDNHVCIVVLDAVNYEVFRSLCMRLNLQGLTFVWSLGYDTPTWIRRTFIESPEHIREVFSNVTYISANPWAHKFLPELRHVFKKVITLDTTFWDSELMTVKPESVTLVLKTRVIAGDRKIIAHYLQPHAPFTVVKYGNRIDIRNLKEPSIEYTLASKSFAWRSWFKKVYRLELANVLIHLFRKVIPWLRKHMYKVYVTADHGEDFGSLYPSMLKRKNPKVLLRRIVLERHVGHAFDVPELHLVPWIGLNTEYNEE